MMDLKELVRAFKSDSRGLKEKVQKVSAFIIFKSSCAPKHSKPSKLIQGSTKLQEKLL